MEIRSEPQYEEVQFTDIDVAYPGEVRSLTLEDGKDSVTDDHQFLTVAYASGEVVTMRKEHMHWLSIRKRTVKRLVKVEKA